MSFARAHPSLQRNLAAKSYVDPTPVQTAVLDAEDRDLLVSAQTGSGKTVAFGLLLARPLLGEAARFSGAGAPLALVVTPTRELALQVHRELVWLYAETGARITTCVGGMDPRREGHALHQGVHIVVGTPGRLCDHLERGRLSLARIQAVVLDEADEMLDMGFREDLERLLDACPGERRTLMFSATIPKEIASLAKKYQRDAIRIAASTETDRHRDIDYQAIPIMPRERDLAVVNLLRYHEAAGALVFCATRDGVTHLAANLAERGFSVAALSGELSQRERNQALQALRDGRARVCVATDVAARGLDLPDLGLVIHADLPQNKQALVHRSGRTGRAGRRGTAILLVPDPARRYVERTLASAHIQAQWMPPPSADDILARDQTLLATEISSFTAELGDDDRQVARTLLASQPAEDLVAALVRLRREARPAPEELTAPPSMRPRQRTPERPRDHGPRAHDRQPPRAADRMHDRPNDRAQARQDRTHDRPNDRARDRAHDRPADRAQDPATDRVQDPATDVAQDRTSDRANDRASDRDTNRATNRANDRANTRTNDRPADRPSQRLPFVPAERVPRQHPAPHDRAGITDAQPAVWFTINIGRSKNADPKWLIPLLCRRGGITKRDIGKIQIFARETRVAISPGVSDRFAESIRQPDPKDKNIHIEPLDLPV